MSVIYVKEQGAYIKKSGEKIDICKNNQKLLSFPVWNIDGLSIIGNIQISTQALVYLMENGVDVSIFSYSGRFVGQALADSSKNIFLRFAQYDLYQNMDMRLDMARTIVRNKISNQMQVIKKYRYKDGFSPKRELDKMGVLQNSLKDCKTPNEIMGVEGMCSNLYFSCFSHMINCRFEFKERNRRPPKDPVNVILSLGYTFLTREVCSVLEAESFEVYLGFLHGIRYGRKSLALDVVEEFRQPIVDRFVVRSFNKRVINEFDFEMEDQQVLLNEEGFKKFCREFEIWMTKTGSSSERSFRQIIKMQIGQLKKAIQNKEPYVPYKWEEKDDICD
ncbi:MAG: CRISPR-associated endonuclease Cas1 [Eubacteriales bacterium]|nr:CRISPR-associated endonuclease Cas1 [Eubacteriales bacterium]